MIHIDLEELVQELLRLLNQHAKTKTDFSYSVSKELLSDELKLNIYRILQEQVNNILKYADAKNVNISIETDDKAISLVVADDGKGFDVEKKRMGVGISNMINRIESFNGKIEIDSSVGNGCVTHICIPI